ncbi:SHQ1-domain-containing protein [Martensiomyces pterosporus]|nr:SHQ1-domain-containing protein [Martensiomyces pterosporus]
MITPRFSVRQDDNSVYVAIHAPHVRAQTIEFDVDEDQFKFFASPYYLRLTFPGKVVEDEQSTASLDVAAGDILVTLTKQKKGEEFENLDLLTGLLATRKEMDDGSKSGVCRSDRKPAIEEIGGDSDVQRGAILEDEEFDWEIPQTLVTEEDERLLAGPAKYGFNEQYSGFFTHVHETANEVNEVPHPEHMSLQERRTNRIEREDAKFDEGYYMDNYINDEDIVSLIQHKSRYYSILQAESWAAFTEEEKKAMVALPRKTHLIENEQAVYLGMVDILFAYSLDRRINKGEPTVESVWSIGTLSPSVSNLEQFSTLRLVIVACFRRALAYPLYRNWELCEKALEDVYAVLRLGRRAVLKVILETKLMFDLHDIYYVYSKIFFDDYCLWLQTTASDRVIRSLAHRLHHFEVDKEEIGWHLDEFEDLALESSDSEDECDEEAAGDTEGASEASDSVADGVGFTGPRALLAQQQPSVDKKPLIQVIGEKGDAIEPDIPDVSGQSSLVSTDALGKNGGSMTPVSDILLPMGSSISTDNMEGQRAGTSKPARKPLIEIIE